MRTRGNSAQSVTGCISGMQSSRATAASAKEIFTASEVHHFSTASKEGGLSVLSREGRGQRFHEPSEQLIDMRQKNIKIVDQRSEHGWATADAESRKC